MTDEHEPRIGTRYRLKNHVGYQPHRNPHHPWEQHPERLGSHAPLFAGQVAEVVGHSPVGEHGGGPVDEHAVILAFEHHELAIPPPTPGALAHARRPPVAGETEDDPWTIPPLEEEHWVFHPTDPEHTPTGVTRHWSCTHDQLAELFDEVDDPAPEHSPAVFTVPDVSAPGEAQ